jgi:CheY-like chemotaxis protein
MKPSSRLRRQSRARSLPARTTRTVLAVAPDAETVAALELDLPQAGYALVVAATGEAAVAILNEEDVDLLLFDLPAPKSGGEEAWARICTLLDGETSTVSRIGRVLTRGALLREVWEMD